MEEVDSMKRFFAVLSVLIAIFLFCASAGAETPSVSDLTLMIYMCGSNLESRGGSASSDLMEMMSANYDTSRVNLLVMTGGTKEWALGFNSDEVSIRRILPGRQITLWHSEKQLNMGDGETLTAFLRFCTENYPASSYALILWDHGGGPLEGVCWDEVFSMNHMSYPELVEAIHAAHLQQKLSWIGFDACLMSSLEIAANLSDVAEYMIASQETEPDSGWNYSFLEGIESDRSPVETGKRIIDCYFDGKEKSRDTLTLACTDLSKAAKAAESLGMYFRAVEKDISAESFPVLSNLRMGSVSFGKGVQGIEDDAGYDLVDARNLVLHMQQLPEEKEALLTQLDECVVYSRSNVDGASGLTLYHPYSNKDKYLSGWKKSYEAMDLIDGYTEYIHSFGALLTGKELVRWNNLFTYPDGKDKNGDFSFRVRLNREQAAHLASAQLLIIRDTGNTAMLRDGVAVISVNHASLTEDGILTGSYDENTLYVEREDGTVFGPLSYLQTDDGRYNVITAWYIPKGEYSFDNAVSVLFYLDAADRSHHPEICRMRIWDDATQSYSSRLPFDQNQFRMLTFWNRNKSYPDERDGILPEYSIWKSGKLTSLFELPLPEDWRFTRLDSQESGVQLYAMFQITDTQQNVFCSVPVPVDNPNLMPFGSADKTIDVLNSHVSLSGLIDTSDSSQSVRLIFNLENYGESGNFRIKNILLNNSRETSGTASVNIPAHGTGTVELVISAVETANLSSIKNLSCLLEKSSPDGNKESVSVCFELDGCDLGHMKGYPSMGHCEQDNVSMDILDIAPDNGCGFNFRILVDNQRQESICPDTLLVNGLELASNCYDSISAGKSRVILCSWQNGLLLESADLTVPGNPNPYYMTYIMTDFLGLHGMNEFTSVALGFRRAESGNADRFILSAKLDSPYAVSRNRSPGAYNITLPVIFPPEAGINTPSAALCETDRYLVRLRRMILGGSELILLLEAENKTDSFLELAVEDMYLNGSSIGSSAPAVTPLQNTFSVAPGGTKTVAVKLKSRDGLTNDTQVETISLAVCTRDETPVHPALITLNSSASTGSLSWISPDQTEIRLMQLEGKISEKPTLLSDMVIVPENILQNRRWVEAPLTKDEADLFAEGRMLLVLPLENSVLSVITCQDLIRNEEGKIGSWFPGLVACSSLEETDLLPLVYRRADANLITADILPAVCIENDNYLDYKSMFLRGIRISVNCTENSASVTETETGGDEFENRSDMKNVFWLAYLVSAENNGGRLPPLDRMERITDYSQGWEENLNGASFQIQLRPFRKEDRLNVLFSVTARDGTGYSIMIPYDEALD